MITLTAIWAVVQVSAAFVRSAPDYESPLQTQVLMGNLVQIDSTDRYWRHITCSNPSYEGWVNDLQLTVIGDNDAAQVYASSPMLVCTALHTIVRDAKRNSICELCMGDIICGIWKKGQCEITLPSGKKGFVRSEDVATVKKQSAYSPHKATTTALKMLGVPYLWGGNSPSGLDCSGLVWLSCSMAGITLPRDASQQAGCGEDVEGAISANRKAGISVLREGDLLFFGTGKKVSHVGIYLSEGRFIHSSQTVRISSLDPDSPDFYSSKDLIAVKRLQ